MSREPVGIAAILVGVIVIIGAAKGTWRQVWYDLTGQSVSTGGGSSSSSTGPSIGPVQLNPGFNPAFPALPFNPSIQTPWGQFQPFVLPYNPGAGNQGYPQTQVS